MCGIIVFAAYLLLEHVIEALYGAYQARLRAYLERLRLGSGDSSEEEEKEPERGKKIGFVQYNDKGIDTGEDE